MADDEQRLQSYVETWARSVDDVVELLRDLDDDAWHRPTDLPGWDVHAVASHLAHLESMLAGRPQQHVEVPDGLPHVRGPLGTEIERGCLARRDRAPHEVVDELEQSARSRLQELRAQPPVDGTQRPTRPLPGVGETWDLLLRNRPFDVWMHEQDVRRAVDRPGGLDTPGAVHAVAVLVDSLPFVLGKRVGASPGTSIVLTVTGQAPAEVCVGVGDDGRARLLGREPASPQTRLRMDTETFTMLGGGRRDADLVPVEVEGDGDLASAVLTRLAVTP